MSDDTSSAVKLVTLPATEPVTLEQAKAFLRIDHVADDDAIARAIVAARKFAETYLRLILLPQTWEYARANPCETKLRLPIGPAQSVESIGCTNELGTSSVMDPANYRLSVDGFSVLFANTPQTEVLTIRFVAGEFATATTVPVLITQGILHHVSVMIEQRDGAAALPVQSITCYQPYRRISL